MGLDGKSWWGSAVPVDCLPVGDGKYLATYLTARHVVGPGQMWVQLFEKPDYHWADEIAEVLERQKHPTYDLALLVISLDHPVEVLSVQWREPSPGEEVVVAGYNLARSLGMSKGLVGSRIILQSRPQWSGSYQTTSYNRPGASGGAVISKGGGLLGIHVAGHRDSEHMGLFLPVVLVRQWLRIYANL